VKEILIRRCSWHPGGKSVCGFPGFVGRWLNVRLEAWREFRWVKRWLDVRFTDGTCRSCTRKLDAEIDALIRRKNT